MRIDLTQVSSRISFKALSVFWDSMGYLPREPIAESDFEEYQQRNFTKEGRQYPLPL